MKKPDADFTRRMLLALASAVADHNHQTTRAIVETLTSGTEALRQEGKGELIAKIDPAAPVLLCGD